MTLDAFTAEMTQRGCAPAGKIFCGVYQGWPFSTAFVRGVQAGKTVFALHLRFGSKVPGKLYRTVAKEVKAETAAFGRPLKLQPQGNQSAQYSVLATATADGEFGRMFDALLGTLARVAARLGLSLPQTCPVCKQAACNSFALYRGAYVPVHDACVYQTAQNKTIEAHENERYGSYGLGILGALLGGIVGAIPTILLAVFLNVISAWLCALLPLGAYYGYKLLRGRMNVAALLASILASLLLSPVVFYLMQDFTIYKEFGAFLGPALFWELAMAYPGDVWPGFVQLLLFVGLGVLVVLGILRRGNKHVVAEAGASVSTLRPMA